MWWVGDFLLILTSLWNALERKQSRWEGGLFGFTVLLSRNNPPSPELAFYYCRFCQGWLEDIYSLDIWVAPPATQLNFPPLSNPTWCCLCDVEMEICSQYFSCLLEINCVKFRGWESFVFVCLFFNTTPRKPPSQHGRWRTTREL